MDKATSKYNEPVEYIAMTKEEFKNFILGVDAELEDAAIDGYLVSSLEEQGGDSFVTVDEFNDGYTRCDIDKDVKSIHQDLPILQHFPLIKD